MWKKLSEYSLNALYIIVFWTSHTEAFSPVKTAIFWALTRFTWTNCVFVAHTLYRAGQEPSSGLGTHLLFNCFSNVYFTWMMLLIFEVPLEVKLQFTYGQHTLERDLMVLKETVVYFGPFNAAQFVFGTLCQICGLTQSCLRGLWTIFSTSLLCLCSHTVNSVTFLYI